MAIVLDGAAAAGIPLNDPLLRKHVEAALDEHKCYMTLASVTEFACLATAGCGAKLAEQWVGWLYTHECIEIVEQRRFDRYASQKFLLMIADAYDRSGLAPAAASSAALAKYMKIPVLTNRERFKTLEEERFCKVKWAR
ncbi:MAG: hypothetical protein ABFD64_13150 [Armatimonadota bacterium]